MFSNAFLFSINFVSSLSLSILCFYSYNNSSPYRTKGGALPDQFGLISYCLPRKEWQRGKCYGRTKTYINLTNVLLFPAKGDFIASFDFVDAVSSEELLSITGYEVLTGSEVERIFKRAGNPKTTDYLSSCSW